MANDGGPVSVLIYMRPLNWTMKEVGSIRMPSIPTQAVLHTCSENLGVVKIVYGSLDICGIYVVSLCYQE